MSTVISANTCSWSIIRDSTNCHPLVRMAVLVEKSECHLESRTTCTEGLCSYKKNWANTKKNTSQKFLHAMLSGGILFTTCLVSKILRALTSINIAVHAKRTY